MIVCWDNSKLPPPDLPNAIREALADRTLGQLSAANPDLLIYTGKQQGKIEGQRLFVTRPGAIWTSNIMGVVACVTNDNPQPFVISVGSRFDVLPDGTPAPSQPFFTYLLSQAFDGVLVDWPLDLSKSEDLWEFLLVFLYVHHLVKACRQGILKQYVNQKTNDFVLAGVLDVPAHLKRNVPFQGKVAQTRRIHTRDNPVLWLIRAAGELVGTGKSASFYSRLLKTKNTLRESLEAIKISTPSFDHRRLYERVAECLRPLRHPYFREFELLRHISLQILRRRGVNLFRRGKGEVYGVLFDGAWLWEEFLAGLLRPEGFEHTRIMSVFKNAPDQLKPDFTHKSSNCVLDAKYKRWDSKSEDDRSADIHQVLAYMYLLGSRAGGVIYPRKVNETGTSTSTPGVTQREIALRKGEGEGFWLDIPFPVPQGCVNASVFRGVAENWRKELSDTLRPLLDHS